MVLILHIHEIIYISLKLIIPSESRWKAPGREVYNPVTREALVFPTSIATPAWFSLCYKSVEFGLYPPSLAYKSSSIFFHEREAGASTLSDGVGGSGRFFMFSLANASERAGARLASPAKNRIKWLILVRTICVPVACVDACMCRRELTKHVKTDPNYESQTGQLFGFWPAYRRFKRGDYRKYVFPRSSLYIWHENSSCCRV